MFTKFHCLFNFVLFVLQIHDCILAYILVTILIPRGRYRRSGPQDPTGFSPRRDTGGLVAPESESNAIMAVAVVAWRSFLVLD